MMSVFAALLGLGTRKLQLSIFFCTCLFLQAGLTLLQMFPSGSTDENTNIDTPASMLNNFPLIDSDGALLKSYTTSKLPSVLVQGPPARYANADLPLQVTNQPSYLPWNVASRDGPSTTVVPVDYSYVYNPSVLELADGTSIFAGRMSWLYGGDCHDFEEHAEAMYNCLRNHMMRFADQTVFGQYASDSSELKVLSPSIDGANVLEFNKESTNITAWNGGPGWFDTRLLYPYNDRYAVDRSPDRKIIMTSQSTELLGNDDWHELFDDSTLALQVTYISTLDTQAALSDPTVYFRAKKMTRWLFYDQQIEQKELETRNSGGKWTPMVADVARLKCSNRPDHLPALPFDPSESKMHKKPELLATNHRRLAALEGKDWVTIKDKNWVPFAYKERLLWSYSIEPHVVCENDIEVNDVDNDEVDCVLCIAKYNSSSPQIFNAFYDRVKAQGFDKVVSHLNGAPSYYIPEIDSYIGILHVIKTESSTDAVGRPLKKRIYEHYFYKTSAQPPFQVTEIATARVPLERSRCWSPWFEIDDVVEAEFVMYMQFHPDRPGQEFQVSYGDGDRYSRVETFGMKEVLATFDVPSKQWSQGLRGTVA